MPYIIGCFWFWVLTQHSCARWTISIFKAHGLDFDPKEPDPHVHTATSNVR